MGNADGKEIVRFDPTYKLRPFPGIGMPGFEQADAKANAFLACWLADFDKEVLEFVAARLPPLAVQIVKWGHAELERARIKSPSSTVNDETAEARLADDGCPLCR
jgi:hypothetical protein